MVEKLILLAAGRGERLRPLTINTPKPLVRVHGIHIIETLLKAARQNGIPSVYIVRGHLGEQFDGLTRDYPNLHFIDNPDYKGKNYKSAWGNCS